GTTVKQLVELSGQQLSIRAIARRLAISRNTVRKYLRMPGLPVAKPRRRRPSKVDPFRDHVRRRLAAGVENCVVLLRELRAQGYAGSYSILKDSVRPLRLGRAVKAPCASRPSRESRRRSTSGTSHSSPRTASGTGTGAS